MGRKFVKIESGVLEDQPVATAALWYNILMEEEPLRNVELKRLRELIRREAKALLRRKVLVYADTRYIMVR